MCIIRGVDLKGAEFIGNEQIHSQAHRHSTLCASTDYYYYY